VTLAQDAHEMPFERLKVSQLRVNAGYDVPVVQLFVFFLLPLTAGLIILSFSSPFMTIQISKQL
jgi:hypothetical protein